MTKNADLWFQNISTSRSHTLRIFCFPYAGGSASIYRNWLLHLPSTIQVVPVELPGRGGRIKEPPLTDVTTLIDELVNVIPPYLDAPTAFFGHSLGAVIAYELAKALNHTSPMRLFVSGRRAPQIPEDNPIRYDLPRNELIKELSRINGTPKEVLENKELMDLMIPIIRADLQMAQTYEYSSNGRLSCPIVAIGGTEDEETPVEALCHWADQTTSYFNLRMLPGNHFFIHASQALLLEYLASELRKHITGHNSNL